VKLQLRVVPRSSTSRIAGWVGDELKVTVSAPPEGGRANLAVEEVLAGALGLPRRAVRVVAGLASRRKAVEIDGLTEADVRSRLANRFA